MGKNKYLLLKGDVVEQFKRIPDGSVDAVITDPPYNLGMDEWDKWPSNKDFGLWCSEWGKECLRVLRPGGVVLAFSAGRTYHWLAWGLEEAGFTTKDMLEWVYWSSMPKGKNLKNCHEPIYFGVKPKGDLVLNVDACRIPLTSAVKTAAENILLPGMPTGKHPGRGAYGGDTDAKIFKKALDTKPYEMNDAGRHPYNIIPQSVVDVAFPTNILDVKKPRGKGESIKGHQTQKPIALMKWLISLVTNPGDIVVDCFAGTGTTGDAALQLDREIILIERAPEYWDIIEERLN